MSDCIFPKNIDELSRLDITNLRKYAKMLVVPRFSTFKRDELISEILLKLSERFVKIKTLGHPGKEGTTYMVYDNETRSYKAMKCFRKKKSGNTLQKEADLQKIAAEAGIAPNVIYVDTDKKFIVMDRLHRTLNDILREQKNILTPRQQTYILQLFMDLDKCGVFHNDPNPANIMEKHGKFYMIDYGFAKSTDSKDIKSRKNINYELMPIGLLIWLRNKGISLKCMNVLINSMSKDTIAKYGFLDPNFGKKNR